MGDSVCQVLAAQARGLEFRCSVPMYKVEHCDKCLQLQSWEEEYGMHQLNWCLLATQAPIGELRVQQQICPPQIKWTVIEEDTQSQPLAYTCMLVCTCIHIYSTHHTQSVYMCTHTHHTQHSFKHITKLMVGNCSPNLPSAC